MAAAFAAGLLVCLLTLVLLYAHSLLDSKEKNAEDNLTTLRLVVSNIDSLWDEASRFAGQAAAQLNTANPKNISALLAQQMALHPGADMSLFDQKGEILPLSGESPTRPSIRSTRAVVQKALVGQTAKDITRSGALIGLSVSVPLHNGNIRALVVTLPLDEKALSLLHKRAFARVGLIPVSDNGISDQEAIQNAANTFTQKDDGAVKIWEEITAAPPRVQGGEAVVVTLKSGTPVGALLLEDMLGVPTGLLVTYYAPVPSPARLARNLAASAGAGILAAFLCVLCFRAYTRRLGSSVAVAATNMATPGRENTDLAIEDWPPALREALSKISGTVREYKKRARSAEAELDAAGRRQYENAEAAHSPLEDDDYLRLFETTPVGVFQAESNGAFVRVNQAFALLLGYDTPVMLLTENVSFTDLCLYGDEIRNPLNMLIEQGGGRQIISLRKRDGKIGDYILICTPITSPSGDRLSRAEGFLLDRNLEDQLIRAERERELADRQRNSLALLLAATSLQTQSALAVPQSGATLPEAVAMPAEECSEAEKRDGDCPTPERRKSVQAVRDIMTDIYQIAMTEAAAAAPVEVPIDLGRFLRRLCRQALPSMQSRGISFFCELAEDLPSRFTGPAPMLRHALQRALLATATPVKGGWASLSVRRDPNAPRSAGLSRVLFSITWSGQRRNNGGGAFFQTDNTVFSGRDDFARIIDVAAPEVADENIPINKTLDIADEQEVIRYLAQRMHGDLIDGAFSPGFRSMQVIIPLTHAGDFEEAAFAASAQAEGGNLDDLSLVASDKDTSAFTDVSMPSVGTDESAPLDILVDDQHGHVFESERALDGPGLDILLVDDSLNNRLLFSLYLKDTKHKITEAHDGQEGVEAFKQGHFDVIFMDMEMPLMDGYQATRIIRALEADDNAPPTPIVAMTSYALPEFRQQCLLSGCTDFLTKPFNKIALYSVIDAFIQLMHRSHDSDDEE